MLCLKYLCGDDMAGPKPRKLSAAKTVISRDSTPFQGYACNALPEHIPYVSSEDEEFFQALSRFLGGSNLLSWIEYIAKESDLNRLILTGRALKQYVQGRSEQHCADWKRHGIIECMVNRSRTCSNQIRKESIEIAILNSSTYSSFLPAPGFRIKRHNLDHPDAQ